MFKWFKTRQNLLQQTSHLYDAVVTQSRNPLFYGPLGVPDTLEGRYEMVVLHLFLIIERLQDAEDGEPMITRNLSDRFVTDMDDSMRELGIGDTTVPKKVKRAAAGLLERSTDYRKGLAAGKETLAATLARHIHGDQPQAETIKQTEIIADYTRASAVILSRQSKADLLKTPPEFANLADFTDQGAVL